MACAIKPEAGRQAGPPARPTAGGRRSSTGPEGEPPSRPAGRPGGLRLREGERAAAGTWPGRLATWVLGPTENGGRRERGPPPAAAVPGIAYRRRPDLGLGIGGIGGHQTLGGRHGVRGCERASVQGCGHVWGCGLWPGPPSAWSRGAERARFNLWPRTGKW